MFAQLANTILHGVRIFEEAAKDTTPVETKRSGHGNDAWNGHRHGENSPEKGHDNDVR